MSDEQAFLREIQAAPADRSVRLVYADWLEERGDPRAELIRIEEEMRCLPFFADRYWQMKPRRNELRAGADEQWLHRMQYGEDHEPLCKDIPQGWRERWRLLREFTERWYGLPMPDVGGHVSEIQQVEASLHLQLPPAMREWIAYANDLGDYFVDVLRDCCEVGYLEDTLAVTLMIAGEADFYWAVQNENLSLDDPPVDWYRLDYQAHRFAHDRQLAPRLTTFVFQHLLTYLSACAPGGDSSKLISADNASGGRFLRYLGDVFLGPDQPLTHPY